LPRDLFDSRKISKRALRLLDDARAHRGNTDFALARSNNATPSSSSSFTATLRWAGDEACPPHGRSAAARQGNDVAQFGASRYPILTRGRQDHA
jgi:hypothetical protein